MTERGTFAFYAQTVPGVEPIAWREVQACSPDATLIGFHRVRERNGVVLFRYRGDPHRLLQLRCAEDVFFLVLHARDIPLERAGLREIEEAIRESRFFDAGLRIHREVRGGRTRKRPTFRVIARKQGAGHRYRRVDVQKAVERAIRQRYNYRWRLVQEHADVEVWLTLLDREVLCGLRLSDRTMRHRDYQRKHLPASLRPAAASAMVLLSDPQPEDVFLDPMCGAGTILIERGLAGRYGQLLGGDIDPLAVEAARKNVGSRFKPIRIEQWDATALPLDDHRVDKVVSNLPFGEQIGSHEHNARLYPPLFRELERVTRPSGRLVLLSGEDGLVGQALDRSAGLVLHERFPVRILGKAATIYVLDRM
jgi:tRNA (guanine6-N2)-methyltransferase